MRFVAVKGEAQLSMQSLHRYRSRLVGSSTNLINQARSFLLERGIAIPQGKHRFAARVPEILEDADNGLPGEMECNHGPVAFALFHGSHRSIVHGYFSLGCATACAIDLNRAKLYRINKRILAFLPNSIIRQEQSLTSLNHPDMRTNRGQLDAT